MNNCYDVVVVGAGPAGSTAARYLAQAELSVLLVDRVRCIGEKVQCAEYVPMLMDRISPIRPVDIAQTVRGIKTIINGYAVSTLEAPGYVLNRRNWDKNLWDLADKAGAHTILGTAVTGVDKNGVRLQIGRNSSFAACKAVVGCDGPNSTISRFLGNNQQECSIALQYEMDIANPMHYVEIFFDPRFLGGYAWVFPKGTRANVGLGVNYSSRSSIEKMLHDFCEYLAERRVLKNLTVRNRTAGLVPCGGLVQTIARDNIILAGDAAGCTNPITGAGIMSAVISGKLAAESLIDQWRNLRAGLLSDRYYKAVVEHLGQGLTRARRKKAQRDTSWTCQQDKFVEIIRNSWIAFPEYYKAN